MLSGAVGVLSAYSIIVVPLPLTIGTKLALFLVPALVGVASSESESSISGCPLGVTDSCLMIRVFEGVFDGVLGPADATIFFVDGAQEVLSSRPNGTLSVGARAVASGMVVELPVTALRGEIEDAGR